jgi:hypothetical protein
MVPVRSTTDHVTVKLQCCDQITKVCPGVCLTIIYSNRILLFWPSLKSVSLQSLVLSIPTSLVVNRWRFLYRWICHSSSFLTRIWHRKYWLLVFWQLWGGQLHFLNSRLSCMLIHLQNICIRSKSNFHKHQLIDYIPWIGFIASSGWKLFKSACLHGCSR